MWYRARLSRMPLREVAYRGRQLLRKKYDKRFAVPFVKESTGGINILVPSLSRDELAERAASFRNEIIGSAYAAAAHRFRVFGELHNTGTIINWHLDPKTGREWPLRYWGDIDYRDGESIGGIKFAWELNRLHHLSHLALGYAITGEEEFRDELFDQIKQWMTGNPYPMGINWISGIELGIRLVNVFFAVRFLGTNELEKEEHYTIFQFIVQHAKHLLRYPSRYSSCANHAIAEALGLFVAGKICHDYRPASAWAKYGRSVLEREVVRQIHPDGSSFEHSVPYLKFVVDHYIVYRLVCRFYGEHYGPAVDRRVESAIEFLDTVTDREGNYPLIGDDDDGHLLKIEFDNRDNMESLRNTGALLYGSAKWLDENWKPDVKTLLLLEEGDLDRKGGAGSADRAKPHREFEYFSDAGIAVNRVRKESREILFIGNSGPLGLRPLAGHGHADALSIWLSVNGRPILIDPNTYLYHGGGKWRDYFRSTAAHNTIRVDGMDQAAMISEFMFDVPYSAEGRIEGRADGVEKWSGSHDGYSRLPDAVIHKREVNMSEHGTNLEIVDIIEASGSHDVECFFHFHPACSVTIQGRKVEVRRGEVLLQFFLDPKWSNSEILYGSENPLGGWYSPKFNHLEKTNTLVLRASTRGEVRFSELIRVFDDG